MQVQAPRAETATQGIARDPRVDDVLASVAHELRNPLASIAHAVNGLQGGADQPVIVVPRATAQMLQRQVGHLSRIVEDLLEGARLANGALKLDRHEVALQAVIHEGIENCERLIVERGHQVDLRLPPETLTVLGDRVRLVQVVTNLIANAAKYTPAGGHLQIRLERAGSLAAIEVIDDGVGVAPEETERIFDSYWQVRRGSGIGLGLSLVRQWVELHGGTVGVRSDGADKGAVFTVRLPLAA